MKIVIVYLVLLISIPVMAQERIYFRNDALIDPTPEEKKLVQSTAKPRLGATINLPPSVDLSKYLPIAGDQGTIQGACSAFVVSFGIKTIQESIKLNRTYFDNTDVCLSPTYVFNRAKELFGNEEDCERGITIIQALTVLRDEGTVPLSKLKFFPFDPYGCKQPVGIYKSIAEKYRISSFDAPELNELEFKRILNKNHPIAICVKVDDKFELDGLKKWTSDSPFIWKSYGAEDAPLYRHAMLCIGYDDNLKAFKILNSYGAEFGVNGFFFISYDFMFKATYDAYIAFDRKETTKDIIADAPSAQKNINVISTMDSQEFQNIWVKKGYYVQFGDIRIGNVDLDSKSQSVTIQVTDVKINKVLNRIDFFVGEEKEFEYEGRLHSITLKKIDKAGIKWYTKTFNINGKAAFLNYKVANL